MEPVLLYITVPNREEAISLSRELLSEKLAACTNITESITALYRWQGEIEHTAESLVIAKSFSSHSERAIAWIKQNHRYQTPCILVIPIVGGNPDYIAWMRSEMGLEE